MDHIYRRFENFTKTLGVRPERRGAWWSVLHSMYSSPDRYYHTLHHVESCLSTLDTITSEAENSELVQFALWFHDIVYEVAPVYPGASEQKSAVLGVAALKSMRLEVFIPSRDLEMAIMCTTHPIQGPIEANPDFKLVYDLDIWALGGVLGRVPRIFNTNCRRICSPLRIGKVYCWSHTSSQELIG